MGQMQTLPWQQAFHQAVPLTGKRARDAGVVGTVALDLTVANSCCCDTFKGSELCCCAYKGKYRVPWPCHCCGAECCCCPHLPHSPQYEQALQAGLRELIEEAGQIAFLEAPQPQNLQAAQAALAVSGERPAGHYVLGIARDMLLKQRWTGRANALLARYSLRVVVFNWVEDVRDDKGNKTGEVLKSALQFYEGRGGAGYNNGTTGGSAWGSGGGAVTVQSPLETEVVALFAKRAAEDAQRGAPKWGS